MNSKWLALVEAEVLIDESKYGNVAGRAASAVANALRRRQGSGTLSSMLGRRDGEQRPEVAQGVLLPSTGTVVDGRTAFVNEPFITRNQYLEFARPVHKQLADLAQLDLANRVKELSEHSSTLKELNGKYKQMSDLYNANLTQINQMEAKFKNLEQFVSKTTNALSSQFNAVVNANVAALLEGGEEETINFLADPGRKSLGVQLGGDKDKPPVVLSVAVDGAAHDKLKWADTVIKINETPIGNLNEAREALRDPTQEINMKVRRQKSAGAAAPVPADIAAILQGGEEVTVVFPEDPDRRSLGVEFGGAMDKPPVVVAVKEAAVDKLKWADRVVEIARGAQAARPHHIALEADVTKITRRDQVLPLLLDPTREYTFKVKRLNERALLMLPSTV